MADQKAGGNAGAGKPTPVRLEDLDRDFGTKGSRVGIRPAPSSYAEFSVVNIAVTVLVLMVALTGILMIDLIWHSPSPPTSLELRGVLPTNADPATITKALAENAATAKVMIDNHKALSDVYSDRFVKIFDISVGKVLWPLLTSLIGFIIGAKSTAVVKSDS